MKKKKEQEDNALSLALKELENINPILNKNKKSNEIVDIITFCNDPHYLDLPNNGFNMWLSQTIILKCFYIGTRGNENLKLTKEEWEWLYNLEEPKEQEGFIYENNIKNVIKLMLEKEKKSDGENISMFRELNLVLGRRSSKTTMASIITSYEVYKLLVINNGKPHEFYNLPSDDEIAIINVALSQQQAGRLFSQIQARLRNSPFFKGRIANSTTSEIRLYTDSDLKKQKSGTNIEIKGSILILCGHSNPDSLAGYNAILILFDELAFYDETGKVTGKYFYNRLKPSIAYFYQYGDGRLVEISSPNTKMGVFYEIYNAALNSENDSILSFQLPTWEVNPGISFDHPDLKRDRQSSLDMFATEFGAQWTGGGAYGNFIETEVVERCVDFSLMPHTKPEPGCNYYMHVDPAKKGNNYACVLVARKQYTNHMGKKRHLCILAGVWIWRPVPGQGLQLHLIDKDIIRICSIFHPMIVTYDDYQSFHSLQLLRSHGINCIGMTYNRGVKAKIYLNLKIKMSYQPSPEILLYDDGGDSHLLIEELKSLKFKQTQRGYSILPDKHGDVKTDDLTDCLAGAINSASNGFQMDLPMPVTVRTGWI